MFKTPKERIVAMICGTIVIVVFFAAIIIEEMVTKH